MIVILILTIVLISRLESRLTLVGEIYDKTEELYDTLDFEDDFSNWYNEGVNIEETDSDSDIPNIYEEEGSGNHVLIADPPGTVVTAKTRRFCLTGCRFALLYLREPWSMPN